MSIEELIKQTKSKLIEINNEYDIEKGHSEADKALCDLLIGLGYKEIVELYEDIEKWYA